MQLKINCRSISFASSSHHEARVLQQACPTSEDRSGIEASEAMVLDPVLTKPRDVDLTDYFSAEVVRKMPAIERTMYANKVRNYWMLKELGEWLFAIVWLLV